MHIQGGLILLKEYLESLPEAEKKVARFILENPEDFIRLSITEVAKKCSSSVAAVVRLCKRLGIDGFKELKIRITWDLSKGKETKPSIKIEPGLSVAEISKSIIYNNRIILDAILNIIDVKKFETATERIFKADRIDIYGVGASGVVAMDLYQKLLRIGMKCSYSADMQLQITSACGLDSNDCAIAISYSGETPSVVKAINEAKVSGAYTISITRFGTNKVSEIADLNLYVPFVEPILREGAMTSRISQLIIIDILFSILASRHPESFLASLNRTAEVLKPEIR